jgi:hypothetical protein
MSDKATTISLLKDRCPTCKRKHLERRVTNSIWDGQDCRDPFHCMTSDEWKERRTQRGMLYEIDNIIFDLEMLERKQNNLSRITEVK